MAVAEEHCNEPPGRGTETRKDSFLSWPIPSYRSWSTLENRMTEFQSDLTTRLLWFFEDPFEKTDLDLPDRRKNEGGTENQRRDRSSSRSGWVRSVDFISRKRNSPCECDECRQRDNPKPAVGRVTVVTSLKKGEKEKAESVNIRYKGGAEDKLRRPNLMDEDLDKQIFSFSYATHSLITLRKLREARSGLQDCLEKMKQNTITNSRDTLMPERRVLVTYFSHENNGKVQMEELSTNTEDAQYINTGTDIFFTYTDDQIEEKLGAPVLVISINLQVHYPEETRFNCLVRWYTEKPLVLLIPVITACVINIVCIVVLSSLSRTEMNKNITTIICVTRDALTPHTADQNFHKILEEICIKHQNDIDQCCIDSSESVKGLLEVVSSTLPRKRGTC